MTRRQLLSRYACAIPVLAAFAAAWVRIVEAIA